MRPKFALQGVIKMGMIVKQVAICLKRLRHRFSHLLKNLDSSIDKVDESFLKKLWCLIGVWHIIKEKLNYYFKIL